MALDGDVWSVSHPCCTLLPYAGLLVFIGQEAVWASELVWIHRPEQKPFAYTKDQTPIIQSTVRPYTD